MRILIFLSIVALGNTSEQLLSTRNCDKVLSGVQPLSASSYLKNFDFNTHASSNLNSELSSRSFSIPVSPLIQGKSWKSYIPSFKQGLASTETPVTVNGFSSSGSYSSGQQYNVQPWSAGAGIGSPSGFSTVLPSSIEYAVSSTSSPYSPTVATQKAISSKFAGEKSDTVLASRFLSTANENDNYPSITSSPLIPKLTSPNPTASPTPYTVQVSTPRPTNTFSKANFEAVRPSSYPPTTFKPYSTPSYSNYNSIFSTPRPLSTYSGVYSTGLPLTTPAPTIAFPKVAFKTETPYFSTTFKPYTTTLYKNYNSIYSTPSPLNTYSRIFSTSVPFAPIKPSFVSNVTSETANNFFKPTQYVPSISKYLPNTYSNSITTQSPPTVTSFSPFSSKQSSSLFSKSYSFDRPSSSYSAISSTPASVYPTSSSFPVFKPSTPTASPTPYSVSVTTSTPSVAFPQLNLKTASPYSSSTLKPLSSSSSLPLSYNSIYSTPKPLTSYSKVFSTPLSFISNVTSLSPVTSNFINNIFSKPFSTNAKSSLSSNLFSTPSTPSASFPIFSSPAPISPTPYSVTVTTPASSAAFLKNNFKPVTPPTSYVSSTYKPYTTTSSLPYSYNGIPLYSTPKTLNTYSSLSSTSSPIVPNAFKFSAASNDFSRTLNTGKSAAVTASQSLKPSVDLTSRFDTVYTPISQAAVSTAPKRIETYSSTYPKSNLNQGSSFSFDSQPGISQTFKSYSGEPSVGFPLRNLNSGVFDVTGTNHHEYYSGNLSPKFKVSEKTLYSPPVPISFSSLSEIPESYSVPAQLSYPSVYSSALGSNARVSSDHESHSPAFGLTEQQVPLTKEYHTVEEPIVKTWKSIDSWKTAPVAHFGSLLN